jgi:hypothetical protein
MSIYVIVMLLCHIPLTPSVHGDFSPENERITVDVTEKALADVLDAVSEAVGCEFEMGEQWDDFPVTASFAGLPLHEGLKRILNGLNNAIIYGSDGNIKILIYGKTADERTSTRQFAGQPISVTPPPGTRPPFRSSPSMRAPNLSEGEETSGTGSEDAGEPKATDQESEEETTETEQDDVEKSDEKDQESEEEASEAEQENTGKSEEPAEGSENATDEDREADEDKSEEKDDDS